MDTKKTAVEFEVTPGLKVEGKSEATAKAGDYLKRTARDVEIQANAPNFSAASLPVRGHSFVHAIYEAFHHHLPLELSPQHVWLVVLQGFARHVEQNAESLRKKFVSFQGQKELEVRRDEFVWGKPTNDWAGVFEEFTHKIEENIGKDNFANITPKFSETTPTEQAVLNLTIMDSLKSYFKYVVSTLCGISRVRLRGSREDWLLLRQRTAALAQYDLGWWTDLLLPILDEFVAAFDGKVDKQFWTSIYKRYSPGGSGAVPVVNGWIGNFFPYVQVQNKTTRNPHLRPLAQIVQSMQKEDYSHLPDREIPDGINQIPFTWKFLAKEQKMKFVSGFSGVALTPDGFVTPIVTWAVGAAVEKNGP